MHPVGTHIEDSWNGEETNVKYVVKSEILVIMLSTWEEGEHHRHPAHDVRPGEPPAAVAFAVVVDRYAGVDGHRQQHKEACAER